MQPEHALPAPPLQNITQRVLQPAFGKIRSVFGQQPTVPCKAFPNACLLI
jgi:hypothetical protein